MNTERPVYLSLTQFRWPIPAISSITHRVTGVFLFVALGYLLWLLAGALDSPAGYERSAEAMNHFLPRFIVWAVLTALAFHIFAGLKHLVMDFHYWDSMRAGRASSVTVFVLSAIAAILAGVWLW